MAIAENIKQIFDVLSEKNSVKKAIKKINSENEKEQDDELQINSAIYGLINTYFSVKNAAARTNIELNGMVVEPNMFNIALVGKNNDPRLIIKMAERNKDFNRLFTVTKQNNDLGKEQFVIQEKQSDLTF